MRFLLFLILTISFGQAFACAGDARGHGVKFPGEAEPRFIPWEDVYSHHWVSFRLDDGRTVKARMSVKRRGEYDQDFLEIEYADGSSIKKPVMQMRGVGCSVTDVSAAPADEIRQSRKDA